MPHRKNSHCGSPQIWEWERRYINTHLSLDLLHGYVLSTLLATVVGTWESQELLTQDLASPKNLSEMQDLSPAPDLLNLCPQRYTGTLKVEKLSFSLRTWWGGGGLATSDTTCVLLMCQPLCQVLRTSSSLNPPLNPIRWELQSLIYRWGSGELERLGEVTQQQEARAMNQCQPPQTPLLPSQDVINNPSRSP